MSAGLLLMTMNPFFGFYGFMFFFQDNRLSNTSYILGTITQTQSPPPIPQRIPAEVRPRTPPRRASFDRRFNRRALTRTFHSVEQIKKQRQTGLIRRAYHKKHNGVTRHDGLLSENSCRRATGPER